MTQEERFNKIVVAVQELVVEELAKKVDELQDIDTAALSILTDIEKEVMEEYKSTMPVLQGTLREVVRAILITIAQRLKYELVVVDNLTSDSAVNALSAKQGKVLKEIIDGKTSVTVVDNLESDSTTSALSAKQGRVLKDITQALNDSVIRQDDVLTPVGYDNKITTVQDVHEIAREYDTGAVFIANPATEDGYFLNKASLFAVTPTEDGYAAVYQDEDHSNNTTRYNSVWNKDDLVYSWVYGGIWTSRSTNDILNVSAVNGSSATEALNNLNDVLAGKRDKSTVTVDIANENTSNDLNTYLSGGTKYLFTDGDFSEYINAPDDANPDSHKFFLFVESGHERRMIAGKPVPTSYYYQRIVKRSNKIWMRLLNKSGNNPITVGDWILISNGDISAMETQVKELKDDLKGLKEQVLGISVIDDSENVETYNVLAPRETE